MPKFSHAESRIDTIDPGKSFWDLLFCLWPCSKPCWVPLFKNGWDAEKTGVVANLNFF